MCIIAKKTAVSDEIRTADLQASLASDSLGFQDCTIMAHSNFRWCSCQGNPLLANELGQTQAYNIDPNLPHVVGMFVAHRI